MGKTSSVYAICGTEAFLSQVEVIDSTTTAVFTAAWPCLASIGSFRYVGISDKIHVDPSYAALRWAVAPTSATAMTSAERALKIASALCFVDRVHLHRNAGSLSWRRRVSRKGYRLFLRTSYDLSHCIFPYLYDTNLFVQCTSLSDVKFPFMTLMRITFSRRLGDGHLSALMVPSTSNVQ